MWRSYPLIWKKCKTTNQSTFAVSSLSKYLLIVPTGNTTENTQSYCLTFASYCSFETILVTVLLLLYPLTLSPPQRQPSTGSKKRNKKTRLKCFFIIFSCWEEALIDLKLLHKFHFKFYSFSISVVPRFRSGGAGIDRGGFLHYVSNFVTCFNPCSSFKQP